MASSCLQNLCDLLIIQGAPMFIYFMPVGVIANKYEAPAVVQAFIVNIAVSTLISAGGGLIHTSSG